MGPRLFNRSYLIIYLGLGCLFVGVIGGCKQKRQVMHDFSDNADLSGTKISESDQSVKLKVQITSEQKAISFTGNECLVKKDSEFELTAIDIHHSGNVEIELSDRNQIPGCDEKFIILPIDSFAMIGEDAIDLELLIKTRQAMPFLYYRYDPITNKWTVRDSTLNQAYQEPDLANDPQQVENIPYQRKDHDNTLSTSFDTSKPPISPTIPSSHSIPISPTTTHHINPNIQPSKHYFPLAFKPLKDFVTPPRNFGAFRDRGSRLHAGSDLYAHKCTPVIAVTDGEVIYQGYFDLGTDQLWIDHTDFVIRYTEINYDREATKEGSTVKAGQIIGWVADLIGVSAHMLHFEKYSGSESGDLTRIGLNSFNRRKDLLRSTDSLQALLKENVVPIISQLEKNQLIYKSHPHPNCRDYSNR